MVPTTLMPSPGCPNDLSTIGCSSSNISSVGFSSDRLRTSSSFQKTLYARFWIFHLTKPFFLKNPKRRMTWRIRSNTDGGGFNPASTNNNNGTRLIRAIQAFQTKLTARFKGLRKDLPMKLLFFLTGFYCSTAFATVIGQTGDWDILFCRFGGGCGGRNRGPYVHGCVSFIQQGKELNHHVQLLEKWPYYGSFSRFFQVLKMSSYSRNYQKRHSSSALQVQDDLKDVMLKFSDMINVDSLTRVSCGSRNLV